jgi:hypothetical protein
MAVLAWARKISHVGVVGPVEPPPYGLFIRALLSCHQIVNSAISSVIDLKSFGTCLLGNPCTFASDRG